MGEALTSPADSKRREGGIVIDSVVKQRVFPAHAVDEDRVDLDGLEFLRHLRKSETRVVLIDPRRAEQRIAVILAGPDSG